MSRSFAAIVSFGVLVGLLVPVGWDYGEDGFPLSNYPMFAKARGRTASIPTVVGVGTDGRRRPLSPEVIGGARWVNLAAKRVLDARQRGRSAALCRDVAARLAGGKGIIAVEVVTETFDTLDYFAEAPVPQKRKVHARCPVAP